MNKTLIIFNFLLLSITAYAQTAVKYTNSPYISVGIGYHKIVGGNLDGADKSSTAYRIALGYYLWEHKKFGLDAEIATQNEEEIKVKTLSNGVAPNMTFKPPLELLFGAHAYYKNFTFFGKIGAAYEQIRFDSPCFNDEDGWVPEIQAGFGWLFSKHSQVDLFYMRTFGRNISVHAPDNGSCNYNVTDHVPSLEGIFLAYVWRLN